MATDLSIKNVPAKLVERLRRRAKAHHRSLQGELLSIIEGSVRDEQVLTAGAVLTRIRRSGLRTPAESVSMIRKDRDGR